MKKLLSVFIALTTLIVSGQPLWSCSNGFKFDKKTEETIIVNEINKVGIEKNYINTETDKVSISDIKKINKINLVSDNNLMIFNYSLDFYQASVSHQNFLTKINPYRVPEVTGIFKINIESKSYSDDKIDINFLPGKYNINNLNRISSLICGNPNDFVLIMCGEDWYSFLDYIFNCKIDDWNYFIKSTNISNKNLIISTSKEQWKLILNYILTSCKNIQIDDKFTACLHLIKKAGNISKDECSYEIAYSNFAFSAKNTIPLTWSSPYLPLFAFQDDENSNYLQHYLLNLPILQYLDDMFTDQSRFHNTYWNVRGIKAFLLSNHFITTNLNGQQIAETIIKLFEQHHDTVSQWIAALEQKRNNTGLLLTFNHLNCFINGELIHSSINA